MPILRAQVVMPRESNLPSDNVVNTFHFLTAGAEATQGQLNNISGALFSFYAQEGPAGITLGGFISDEVVRDQVHVNFYDMSDPEPRAPIFVETSFLWPDDGGPGLPGEVSICASFRGDLASGVNMARRRGRVYIGPLTDIADSPVSDEANRPHGVLRQRVLDSMEQIRDSADNDPSGVPVGDQFTWGIYSIGARDNTVSTGKPGDPGYVFPRNRPLLPPIFTPVTTCWVDNEWDTQRRRGRQPTVRIQSSAP